MKNYTKWIVGGIAVAGVAYLYFSPAAEAKTSPTAPGLNPGSEPGSLPPAGPSEAQKQAKADFDTFLGGLGSLWGAAVATHTNIKAQLPRPLPPPNAYAAPSIPVLPPLSPRTDWQAVAFLGLPNSRVFAAWDVYDNYAEEFEAGSTILIISPSENAELKAAGYSGTVFYAPGKNQKMCRFYTSVELGPYLKTL